MNDDFDFNKVRVGDVINVLPIDRNGVAVSLDAAFPDIKVGDVVKFVEQDHYPVLKWISTDVVPDVPIRVIADPGEGLAVVSVSVTRELGDGYRVRVVNVNRGS